MGTLQLSLIVFELVVCIIDLFFTWTVKHGNLF